jgi:pyridoxine kinase
VVSVLSIQSHVAYGHVGNSSAVFPLQRLGIEVWPVHTVQFSNHTGYGQWTGRVFDGQAVEEVVQGISDRGVLGRCDAVLSGYLGSADIGHAVVQTVGKVRDANSDAVYCCDPVIGDVGRGIFVRPGIEEFMREVAVPAADVVTPNHFELDLLSGTTTRSLAEVKDAVTAVQGLGPRVVLTTSLVTDDTPDDAVDLMASKGGRHFRVSTVPATPSPPCSSPIGSTPARPATRSAAPRRRSSGCSSAPRTPVHGRSCWSPRRTSSSPRPGRSRSPRSEADLTPVRVRRKARIPATGCVL